LSNFFTYDRYSHRFVTTLITVILCPILFFAQSQIQIPDFKPTKMEARAYTAPFFKFVTIGYWPAAVDWMWIQAIQIGGSKNYSPELIPPTRFFYEMVTDIDPKFYALYEQGGVLFSFFFHAPEESIHLLEKGIRAFNGFTDEEKRVKGWSHPYTLHLLLAYVYSFEVHDWAKAKECFLKAANVPGAPKYLQAMRTWLNEKGSEKVLAHRVLVLLVQNTTDPVLKTQYEEKLKNLSQ